MLCRPACPTTQLHTHHCPARCSSPAPAHLQQRRQAVLLVQRHPQLGVEGCLQAGAPHFSVAHGAVAVPQRQQAAHHLRGRQHLC